MECDITFLIFNNSNNNYYYCVNVIREHRIPEMLHINFQKLHRDDEQYIIYITSSIIVINHY